MDRHIIHLHIPAFSIAVERVRRPALRDRPVAVAPAGSERALILSVSKEARREGVFKGMPLGRALKFCPDLMVLPPDPVGTEKAFRVVTGMAARYTPIWEPFRPGHVYMDITGTERLWGRAKETAARLRREIGNHLSLSGTVGVAGNKMVSSIASRMLPSAGILDVGHGRESAFMAPLKVDVLPGIGHVRRSMLLEELNITLVREIAAMEVGNLKLIFGREAYVIHQRAHGIDPTPVYPPSAKPVVKEETTLPGDENDDRVLLGVLYKLIERCSLNIRNRGLVPQKAGLLLRYTDQMEAVRKVPLSGSGAWDFDLYRPLEKIFYKACERRVRIRFMRVWFWDFLRPSGQISLFPENAPDQEKRKAVTKALDGIRARYGEEAIGYARAA